MAPNTKSKGQQAKPKTKTTPASSNAPKQTAEKKKKTESNAVKEALNSQWLEFAADLANRKNLTDDQAMNYLVFLNSALTGRPFLTENRPSAADMVVYDVIRDSLSKLSFQDKERITNVCRWFSYFQSLKGHNNPKVIFSLTPLY